MLFQLWPLVGSDFQLEHPEHPFDHAIFHGKRIGSSSGNSISAQLAMRNRIHQRVGNTHGIPGLTEASLHHKIDPQRFAGLVNVGNAPSIDF